MSGIASEMELIPVEKIYTSLKQLHLLMILGTLHSDIAVNEYWIVSVKRT